MAGLQQRRQTRVGQWRKCLPLPLRVIEGCARDGGVPVGFVASDIGGLGLRRVTRIRVGSGFVGSLERGRGRSGQQTIEHGQVAMKRRRDPDCMLQVGQRAGGGWDGHVARRQRTLHAAGRAHRAGEPLSILRLYWDQQQYKRTVLMDPSSSNVGTIHSASGYTKYQAFCSELDSTEDAIIASEAQDQDENHNAEPSITPVKTHQQMQQCSLR